jgi:hypothetical protein
MDYDFLSREREFGRVILALILDRKKMTERVIIGKSDETRRRLEVGEADVFYDETRPIGSLLINMETDKAREWNTKGMKLRESYEKAFPLESKRWKLAGPVASWLDAKYKSGEPSAMFASVRTWETYLNCFNMNHGPDLLTERLNLLYRPFFIYSGHRPWQEPAGVSLSRTLGDEESQVELWYPVKRRPFEVVAAFSSLMPLIFYYLFKLEEWRFAFQECKACGKIFAAKSRHYELCSDECRKAAALGAKREFDERAKENKVEHGYEIAYNYWYTRYRKLIKGKHADPDKAAVVKAAFDAFRKEAVKMKKSVKDKKTNPPEFENWLFMKCAEVDELMDGIEDKKDR